MIARLLELELSAFRCFPNTVKIPLDANVVLIHGVNGTGKTSLLSALEFAISGRVEELSKFDDDYPRCLQCVNSESAAKATLKFLTNEGAEQGSSYRTDAPGESTLSLEDVRFFRDRCFLSQSSLGRLLEVYQSSSKDNPEQPLVRFVRELLGLDLLENLTGGLHEAANILRLEKGVPLLQRAREEDIVSTSKLQTLEPEVRSCSARWNEALAVLQNVIAEIGDPSPQESWTPQGVRNRAEVHARLGRASGLSVSIQTLRHNEGRLRRALGILRSAPPAPIATLEERLNSTLARQTEIETIAGPILERAEFLLRQLGHQMDATQNFEVRFDVVASSTRSVVRRWQTDAQTLAQTALEVTRLREEQITLAKELSELEPVSVTAASISQRWAAVLASVLERLDGEDCPVCGRDFSELSSGDLRTHVTDEIRRIGADAQQMEAKARHREYLAVELAAKATRLMAVEAQFKTEQDRQAGDRSQEADLVRVTAELTALAPSRAEWQERRNAALLLKSDLAATQAYQRQRLEAAAELQEIGANVSVPGELNRAETEAFATALTEFIQEKAEELEKQAAGAARIREALGSATAAADAWEKCQQDYASCLRRQQKARALQSRMNVDIESARNVSKAATRAKTQLLEQVFNEKLNKLWRELFRRLVKEEQFHPRLAEPKTVRGLIRTTVEGCHEGVSMFKQFAAVASSGNLNTAALSLFLSLNLIEQPRHKFIALDDPVQAMDDVHVVQLANLLREIQRQSRRQLLVAVHERALFDYLCLELGPTGPQTTLQTIELQPSVRGHAPEISCTLHRWKPDTIRFGVP
jgi:DNA repair protein SbcC/Rad50